jgi:hypothetical protein
MNMLLLTGISVALALSVMTTNNFYVNMTTNTSMHDTHKQIDTSMQTTMQFAKNLAKIF